MQGFRGDTLASALVASGVRVIGRSLKYHRPRGFFGAGLEDPNSMLEVRDGFGYEPAIRAGQVRLAEGLEAHTITGWPSAMYDAGAVAQLTSPLLKAGFYYKTFMWPGWKVYEPFIRRATGFGRPDPEVSLRPREHRHDTCDVLIIGGGAAGIAAACGLVGSGLRVLVADGCHRLGGAMLWEDVSVNGKTGTAWAAAQQIALAAEDGIDILTNTVVTGAYEGNFFTLLQSRHVEGRPGQAGGVAAERVWKLRARHVVLAAGSVERPLVFSGNDRPGIMLASAVRQFIGIYGVAPARDVAVFTNNDSGYRTALAAAKAGLHVAAVIDTRSGPSSRRAERLAAAKIPCLSGAQVTHTRGYKGLREITVSPVKGGPAKRIKCSILALSAGATPLVHLAAQRGARPAFDSDKDAFICPDLPAGWHVAGGAGGTLGFAHAMDEGLAAAKAIRLDAGASPVSWPAFQVVEPEAGSILPFRRASFGRTSKMWVDLQNDVTVSDIELAASEGYVSVEHLKRYTTLGMGTDQGRTSNINAIALMAEHRNYDVGEVGTTSYRPPFTGVRLGAIAHIRQGALYRPKRLIPAHDSHDAAGAVFLDFGWERPDWYSSNGSDREAAIAVEMDAVRNAVGLFDGSPLGKIEVSGPDAAKFLDRFYVSNIMTLKPGRVRYSVMLKEDGVIFDDGVVTCIAKGFYLAGPTSANADAVSAWFERWRQTEWSKLRVAISPVTSNWASIAISGPRTRDLLSKLEPDFDIAPDAFPHMSYREGRLAGVHARISRVSFTGELQYEINVPARYGRDLWDRLMNAGHAFGARPVGMEAWLRLRLEKGYLHVGSDTDGRTMPMDIGMGGLVDRKTADFIGKRSLSMAFGRSEEREELVGLRAVNGRLRVGGRIMAPGETAPPCATEGYVTSSCYSQTLGGHIGLALIRRGRSRKGETVRIADAGAVVEAEICAPTFYDPENRRLRS